VNTVNHKRDADSYDCCYNGIKGYQHEILCDANNLYKAFLKAKKNSDWKPQVQKFEMTYLIEIAKMQKELRNKTYKLHPVSEFVISERGKTRVIHGEHIADRVVKHCLCDEILMPGLQKYLIYDNGANQKGKGVDFTRRRLLEHLHSFYRENGSNDGYILLIDFSKYFDNIRHDVLLKQFENYGFHDVMWLLKKIMKRMEVDVSYMSDEEYANCMDTVFDSLEHSKIDKSLLTGKKMMAKHLDLGDQVAQIAGIIYPIPIDNYVKIVKGMKRYSRYMDDSYVIHESKEVLQELLKEIIEIAKSIGITVNQKKTRICKLSDYWRFMQIQYSMTETGHVIKKINPKRPTTIRRRMKKVVYKLSPFEFSIWYRSWFKGHCKFMSKEQRRSMDEIFYELLKERRENVQNQIE